MATVPHWDDDPDVWDTLVLGGDTFPGVARVKITRSHKVDEKAAKGKKKATLTDQGVECAKVSITIEITSTEELATLVDMISNVEPKGGGSPLKPLDILHPMAAIRGVRAILITKIDGPELKNGIMSVSIEATEFSAPPVPTGGGPGGGDPSQYTNPDSKSATSTPDASVQTGAQNLAAALTPDKAYKK